MRISRLLLLVLWGFPSLACAQQENRIPFLEASSITVPFYSGSALWFESGIFPHFVVAKSRPARGDPENVHRWALLLTPGIRFRMTRERSNPVRTPSYMPRIDFQDLWSIRDHGNAVDVWEWHAAIGHHSNGQNGCLFRDQTVVNDVCDPAVFAGDPAVRIVNNQDGSFSTNYLEGGINFRHNHVDAAGQTRWDWTAGGEYQRQFATDPELKPVYTQNRLNGRLATAWKDLPWASRLEAGITLSLALDQPLAQGARWSFLPQIGLFPWDESGPGFFVRLYRGQDYYNLHFKDRIPHRVEIGVEFTQDGFFKFEPR